MFDVVVIGSGYAGSVVAARLSLSSRVVLVERGRRWDPGQFPTGLRALAQSYLSARNPLGLWAVRMGAGTGNALVSAFGGASVVNYGITTQPDNHVFNGWPLKAADLRPYFRRAREVLRPTANPRAQGLRDIRFLDMVEPGKRVDLENTIDWTRCTECGNCVAGCNEGAKRSLDQTYLAVAAQQGAEILTEKEVLRCEPRAAGAYRLVLRGTGTGEVVTLDARRVVLCAGTLGTLEFLHRNGDVLPTSAAFGQRMSMNGDSVAFLYNTRFALDGHQGAPVSTSVRIPFHGHDGRTRTLTVMSGRVPAMAGRLSGALLALIAGFIQGERHGHDHDESALVRAQRRLRDLLGKGGEGSALAQTFMYKLDGEDAAAGQAAFDEQGRAAIDWPDYSEDPMLRFAAARLEAWARKVGGTVVRDLGTWPGMHSFSVHPLGGCRMAATVEEGVVDPRCRLYRPDGTVYETLRVVDGSVIPTSLGVPPSFTIAALAERVAEDMLRESVPPIRKPDKA